MSFHKSADPWRWDIPPERQPMITLYEGHQSFAESARFCAVVRGRVGDRFASRTIHRCPDHEFAVVEWPAEHWYDRPEVVG